MSLVHPVEVIHPAELSPGESFAEAIARHPDRDVVIVEPGAEPGEGWLERLAACARREASVATVSAFANAGPLAYRAPLPAREIDALFARENAGVAVEIPSPAPGCCYITRRALTEAGSLEGADSRAIADFSARCSAAALRHVACADVYVALRDGAERDVPEAWRDFERRGVAVPLKRRIDLARLRASRKPRILFVTHAWGGGVELHVNDLARLLAGDCEILVLRPGVPGTIQLQWLHEGETLAAWFDALTQWNVCVELLRSLGVARVHIHHVHGLPREALELPRDLGVPYDITLHDHFAMCPQYHLADEEGRYCGEPDEAGCRACIAKRPAQWNLDIADWRALFRKLLGGATRVIVPSSDIGTRIQRYFPDVQPQVWPHPEMREESPRVHKILLLGGLSAIKGMDLFEACVRDAVARDLPLHFQVLGHTSRPLELEHGAPVAVLGSYSDERLGTLVSLERPDAFLFLSQVPETYSYTLSMAMQSGKPIVATAIGAFVERLRGYPASSLVAPDANARSVNDALLRHMRGPSMTVARPMAASAD